MSTLNIIRAYDAKIDDVRSEDMSLVCRVNTSDVDYYETVLAARGIRMNNYESLGKPVLWEHSKDPRRYTDPIGNALWIKNNGGSNPTEIIARPRFLRDDFSRQRWEWFRDEVIKGWSINILPDADSTGPPTKEELRSRPDWEGAKLVYRGGTLVEFSGTVLPGNPRALTDSRAAQVMDLVQRNLLWLPEGAEPIYREAASRTSVLMPGLSSEPRTMTDSTGGLAGGGAAVKPATKEDDDKEDDDEEDDDEDETDEKEHTTEKRHIVKKKGKYYVYSEDRKKKLGGPYATREEADKRLGQIEYFKHEGERSTPTDNPIQHDGHGGWLIRGMSGVTFPDRETAEQCVATLSAPQRDPIDALNQYARQIEERNLAIQAEVKNAIDYARAEFELHKFGIV